MVKNSKTITGHLRYRLLGKFFGFPKCCIEEFVIKSKPNFWFLYKREFCGNGFIPCDKCVERIKKDKIKLEDLISNRICTIPYSKTTLHPSLENKMDIEIKQYLKTYQEI